MQKFLSSIATRPVISTLLVLVLSAFSASSTQAATIGATATPFTGDPLSVSISIDDAITPGSLVITLQVEAGNLGDLRGFFAHVTDESLLSGLSVTGGVVTESVFNANSVINLGGGSNLNGGGSPCPCDLGIEIGTPGIGSDDFQTAIFTLTHATQTLDLSFFSGIDFGVRATSVGPAGSRSGSSKSGGVIPEPTAAVLMMLGLGGLASIRNTVEKPRSD